VLLGDEAVVRKLAAEHGLQLSKVEIINPAHSADHQLFAQEYFNLRKARGGTAHEAEAKMLDPLYYGAMMVRMGTVDAAVAGAVTNTSDVLRAAIQVIGVKPGLKTVSSSFLMTVPHFQDQYNRPFFFADCAVVPNPTAAQLVDIALATAQTMKLLLGESPKIAMLSFSTKGSAKHEDIDKVLSAVEILKRDYPELKVDGELQLDAAVIPSIAKRKAPDSTVAGTANILIFPDLDAGNIGYKLVERFGGATATGPIIQGLAKPFNDLSRGCSADDIADTVAIALLMKG
jgi:phosphate acetyltransferase